MEAKINWQGGLSFTGTAETGFTLNMGASADVGGQDDGFRPMELLLIGLGGCTAMDVISILTKKRQEVTGFEVKVHAERADEHPRVITSAVIEYLISGRQVDEGAVLRAIELSALRYCPAQAMFSRVFPIALKYSIFEEQDGQHSLIKSGVYTSPM